MYDCSKEFNKFYRTSVVLSENEQNELREKRKLNVKRLKEGLLLKIICIKNEERLEKQLEQTGVSTAVVRAIAKKVAIRIRCGLPRMH